MSWTEVGVADIVTECITSETVLHKLNKIIFALTFCAQGSALFSHLQMTVCRNWIIMTGTRVLFPLLDRFFSPLSQNKQRGNESSSSLVLGCRSFRRGPFFFSFTFAWIPSLFTYQPRQLLLQSTWYLSDPYLHCLWYCCLSLPASPSLLKSCQFFDGRLYTHELGTDTGTNITF